MYKAVLCLAFFFYFLGKFEIRHDEYRGAAAPGDTRVITVIRGGDKDHALGSHLLPRIRGQIARHVT